MGSHTHQSAVAGLTSHVIRGGNLFFKSGGGGMINTYLIDITPNGVGSRGGVQGAKASEAVVFNSIFNTKLKLNFNRFL